MSVNILFLTLKKQWFDEIKAGTKKTEFRDKTKWIKSRLFNKDGTPRKYDFVVFQNGYKKDSPRIKVEFLGFETTPLLYEINLGMVE